MTGNDLAFYEIHFPRNGGQIVFYNTAFDTFLFYLTTKKYF